MGFNITTKRIDVVEVLGSQVVMGRHRGTEVWGCLKEILNAQDELLVVIDLIGANPLQYVFCQYAFGPLIEFLSKPEKASIYVLFKMKPYHVQSFFHGVLRHFSISSSLEDAKDKFIKENKHVKIQCDDDCAIEYVGQLDELDRKVLEEINKFGSRSIRELSDTFKLSFEEVNKSIEKLMKYYFVIAHGDVDHKDWKYYSIQSCVKEVTDA